MEQKDRDNAEKHQDQLGVEYGLIAQGFASEASENADLDAQETIVSAHDEIDAARLVVEAMKIRLTQLGV